MNSIDHMVNTLTADEQSSSDLIGIKIAKSKFDDFLKEFCFEKLKNRKLAICFLEKFKVSDSILILGVSDDFAIDYIKKYLVE